jgi:acetyl esterase/lipase
VGGGSTRVALAVVDVEHKSPPVIAASAPDADVRSFQWVTDDRLVFDVVDLQSGGRDQNFAPGLYSVRRDGSEVRQLIRSNREFAAEARLVRRETLHWNHTLLTVPRDDSGEVIVGEYVVEKEQTVRKINALRLNVVTGRTRSLSVGTPPHVVHWIFDPRGEPRVLYAINEGMGTVFWRGPDSQQWAVIASEPYLQPSFMPQFVDSAGRLYVTMNAAGNGTAALKLFDFARNRPEAEPFVSTPGFDFVGELASDEGGATVGLHVNTDAWSTLWFQARMKQIQKAVDDRLPGRTNVLSCRRCADPAIVLVQSWSDQDPGSFWLYRPAADAWQLVGRVRPEIDPARAATLDFHRIKTRDGLEMPVWLTLPSKHAPGAPAARPAIVLVHGGPWLRGGEWRWRAETQFLASRGYVVIEPEFRGSTGYGQAHFEAGWKQWEGAMQDDVADAVRWAAARNLIDPKRVCIAGASYGGYATLMGLVRYPELYRCGVAWVAVTDPRLLSEVDWTSDISDEGRRYQLPTLLGDLQADAEMLKRAAPVERADAIRAPLLLAFGRQDRRVPLYHGTRMREALKAVGRDPEYVVYDDEGHGWSKVANKVDFWTRVERFLERNLGAPGKR